MSKETGGPAFPVSHSPQYPTEIGGGLTMRDYFAAKFFAQALSMIPSGYEHYERASSEAYAMADAMLSERAK